jgi:hypothetical protein
VDPWIFSSLVVAAVVVMDLVMVDTVAAVEAVVELPIKREKLLLLVVIP